MHSARVFEQGVGNGPAREGGGPAQLVQPVPGPCQSHPCGLGTTPSSRPTGAKAPRRRIAPSPLLAWVPRCSRGLPSPWAPDRHLEEDSVPKFSPHPGAQGLGWGQDKGEVHVPPPTSLSGAFGFDMRDFSFL